VQRGTVVNDDSNELKDIDGDEVTIQVIALEKERLHYDVMEKRQMPTKAKRQQVPTSPIKTAVAKSSASWHPW
jgi:hypothetical protein